MTRISLSLMVMDLFPSRRGMASSLSGFVGGMINALVAGVISPALSHSPVLMSLGMGVMMLGGLALRLALSVARAHTGL